MHILTFSLDSYQFGLDLHTVSEVVRAVFVTPLPGAPEVVEGVIDVRGNVVPVLDTRRRFGLPARTIRPADMLILTEQHAFRGALHVDRVGWPIDVDRSQLAPVPESSGGARYVEGVLRTSDGLIVIHDVNAFLNRAEVAQLRQALDRLPDGAH